MIETLEHFIRQAAEHPNHARTSLYKELLRSETFLLTVDDPLQEQQVTRVTHADETFPVWADKDPEMGGVWVPVFPARDAVAAFVGLRGLRPPQGKEFLWMGHEPGTVFALLRGVPCFAGVRLYLDDGLCVNVPWSHVKALSEGKIPPERPELYELPVARIRLPKGARLAFGRVSLGPENPNARFLCLPEAGHFRPEDVHKLVRLNLGEEGAVWMPCKHFLQTLRFLSGQDGRSAAYVHDLLASLMSFEMYGEAEALCRWLIEKGGDKAYASAALSSIYGKTGRGPKIQ